MKAHWPISILSTLSSLVSMALPLILVRSLDPSTLGSFKVFFLYLMVLPPLTFIAGVSNGLSYWAGHGQKGKKAIRVSAILFLVLASLTLALLLLFKIPLSEGLHVGADWISLFAYALFFGIATMFYDDAAIATGRIWTGAIFNSGFELVRTGAIVVTALYTHDLFSIIKAHIAVQVLKMITGYVLAYRQDLFRFEWDPAIFKEVATYAFPVSLAFVFGLWLNYSDQIILSKTISSAQFALYTVCCLTVPPILILEASVTRVLIPELSKRFALGDFSNGIVPFRKAIHDLSFLIIPAVAGMVIFASPIIELLFTKTYLSGVPYLRLYAFWYLTLLIPQDAAARARGQAKWILGNFISFSIITLSLCFLGGRIYGAMGVLGGLLLARILSRAYTLYYMRRTLKWKISDFLPLKNIATISAISVGLGAICFYFKSSFDHELSWFLVCGGGFTIAYFLLAFSLLSVPRTTSTKVLMLTPGLFIGGLERMILNLSKSLKLTSVWEPQVLAYDFAPGNSSNLVRSFESLNIPVRSETKPKRFSLRTATQIVGTVSRDGVRVIHTHDLGALIYGVIAKLFLLRKVRLVHTQHSFVHLDRSWKYRYYERFFTLFANSIAVVSEDTADSYVKLGIPEEKIHVIPNGVDLPQVPDLNRPDRVKARDKLCPESSIGKDDYWILYLARIHGRKGQDHAITLWNTLDPRVRKKCRLIFVGPETENGEKARIEIMIASAHDSDRISMPGASMDPLAWIRCADIFLSCSEFEGMPLSPIEAIGSGIPALLSDIPGHEFLKPYAATYPLSEPDAGAAELTAIVSELDHHEVAYRNYSWENARPLRDTYTLKTMSTQYEKLYGCDG